MKCMQSRLSVTIVFLILFFCSIFCFKQLRIFFATKSDQSVIIQNIQHDTHEQNRVQVVVNDAVEERQEQVFVIADDTNQYTFEQDGNILDSQNLLKQDEFSFVTMPIAENYTIDIETQCALDSLIGNDLNLFIHLILQSNNNVLSKQACKSCNVHALFKKVKRHTRLSIKDMKLLQHVIGNLYRFIQTMQSISNSIIITPEQYDALQFLNRPQSVNHAIQLQARKVAATQALIKLQSMSHR